MKNIKLLLTGKEHIFFCLEDTFFISADGEFK